MGNQLGSIHVHIVIQEARCAWTLSEMWSLDYRLTSSI